MAATFNHLAIFQDNDFIAVTNRTEPVSDDDAGTTTTTDMVVYRFFSYVRPTFSGDG